MIEARLLLPVSFPPGREFELGGVSVFFVILIDLKG